MQRKAMMVLLICLLGWAYSLVAQANPPVFVENQDYLRIAPVPALSQTLPENKVTIIEFFSYGCPACARLEPDLEKWSGHLPHYVHFLRVPVVFEPDWQVYARTYYVLNETGLAPKLNPVLFRAIHAQDKQFPNAQAMADFLALHGVSKTKFLDLYKSAAIDQQMRQGQQLATQLKIFQIPSLIVGDQYKVDPSLSGPDNQRLLAIVNTLARQQYQKSEAKEGKAASKH